MLSPGHSREPLQGLSLLQQAQGLHAGGQQQQLAAEPCAQQSGQGPAPGEGLLWALQHWAGLSS